MAPAPPAPARSAVVAAAAAGVVAFFLSVRFRVEARSRRGLEEEEKGTRAGAAGGAAVWLRHVDGRGCPKGDAGGEVEQAGGRRGRPRGVFAPSFWRVLRAASPRPPLEQRPAKVYKRSGRRVAMGGGPGRRRARACRHCRLHTHREPRED